MSASRPVRILPARVHTAAPRTLVDELLAEQRRLSAAEHFSRWHGDHPAGPGERYRALLPAAPLQDGQQYAFEVNLDACTGCKACVAACHSQNGLTENETWRSAGLLVSEDWRSPQRQTITTACHHCEDPACANGCPTLAYEKDERTGIVRHLDDQCMGCGYCTMTCPYEVPQMEPSRGIVRKCDMCRQRLDAGEAPACVQACPNEAIRIIAVNKGEASPRPQLLPSAPPSEITRPTTRYVSERPLQEHLVREDAAEITPQHGHVPLVFMLTFTQWGAGSLLAAALSAEPSRARIALVGLIALHAGLAASVLHLGRPLQAWRAILGWRKSWLSREVLAFGVCAAAASAAVALPWMGWPIPALLPAAAVAGVCGVFTSGMVYHVTKRQVWRGARSVGRFFGTAIVLGISSASMIAPQVHLPLLAVAVVVKMAAELRWARCDDPSQADNTAPVHTSEWTWMQSRHHRLLTGTLGLQFRLRLMLGAAGAFCALAFRDQLQGAVLAVTLVAAGELLERLLFFKSAVSWRMPGWRTVSSS